MSSQELKEIRLMWKQIISKIDGIFRLGFGASVYLRGIHVELTAGTPLDITDNPTPFQNML